MNRCRCPHLPAWLAAALWIAVFGVMLEGAALAQGSFSLSGKAFVNPDAAAAVVVYNSADPESKSLADFYMERRGIPPDQVVGLPCSTAEEISRTEYDDTIAEPLRKAFTANFWWKLRAADDPLGPVESCRIRYMVLMRGMPLKIAPAAGYEGDKPQAGNAVGEHNEAAVDSELALLGVRMRVISGAVNNPYFKAFRTIHDAQRPELILVARLDGPSSAIVRRMIVDSLAVEETGLRGMAYIDARGITMPGLAEGDKWLQDAANGFQQHGLPVVLDRGEQLFPAGYPMRNAAIYLGWYAADISGAFVGGPFRFKPGAVACHIHSFSGSTVRSITANWVGPLLNLGAAATLGNVYEPYLALTPNLEVFAERLRGGYTFAEAAYASQRVLSWMTTFVGDPLYRPFPLVAARQGTKETAEWDDFRKGSRAWFTNPAAGEAALKASAAKLNSGMIWEGLGLLQIRGNNVKGAIASFEQARKAYVNPDDSVRATIHLVFQLRGAGREADAIAAAQQEAKKQKLSPAIGVLRMIAPAAFPQASPAP